MNTEFAVSGRALRRVRKSSLLGVSVTSLALALAGGVLVTPDAAMAGPTACTVSGGVATCSVDQSNGVSYIDDASVVEIDLQNLTKPVAPPAGTRGVALQAPTVFNASGPALTVKTDSSVAMTASGDYTSGISVSDTAGQGASGSTGSFFSRDGGDAQTGGAGSGITINNVGTISVNGTGSGAIDLTTTGGQGGVGGLGYYEVVLGVTYRYGTGGSGGTGGVGGNINVDNSGALNATGDNAHGINALSQGGAGNIGGYAFSNGTASAGGNGGAVHAANTGFITSDGLNASAIDLISLGGDGSDGTYGGSSGAAGGAGSTVDLGNSGFIGTTGNGADGIMLESLGGYGGDGLYESGFVASGGNGGAGGSADAVTLTDSGGIVATTGDSAFGIFAQSLGGDGGAGANAGGVVANSGTGGNGGNAGAVSVTLKTGASVTTSGTGAHAVLAESQGGTGGNGGSAGALWADGAGGGSGGSGGNVAITSDALLATTGNYAYGMFGESVGGAGGGGGGAGGGVALGGASGGGSLGGTVTLENDGIINTGGIGSLGIFALSIGGTGGDAGSGGGAISFGGSGSDAAKAKCESNPIYCNNAGDVTVANSGTIITANSAATGIFAESIGGGGGNGGASNSFIAIGGAGGAGGNGGAVNVTNSGTIQTNGDLADDIFAQSVGGGGGNAGDATSIALSTSIAIGDSGGSGGDGGTVTIDNTGILLSQGNAASPIFAQSVGGGGGNGGDATATGISLLPVAIGGSGGDGGDGGAVSVTNNGFITVAGDHSDGVFAQSVGGGGGNGGSGYAFGVAPFVSVSVAVGGSGGGGGNGGTVNVANNGFIETWGDNSRGVFAQSVGGGGGTGGSSVADAISLSPTQAVAISVSVGGSGGDGGIGGDVTVSNTQAIITLGDSSHGIQAQSVGGGGGVGGDASGSATAIGAEGAASLTVSVGGHGGSGNNAGTASVTNSGDIQTYGDISYGIFAQSVGGGGGEGGMGTSDTTELNKRAGIVITGGKKLANFAKQKAGLATKTVTKENPSKAKSIAIGISVGGYGGGGGDGNTVTLDNSGTIETWGYGSTGIFAQSVGGGGGDGNAGSEKTDKIPLSKGVELGAGWGGNGGASGNGGEVDVTNTGSIITRNDTAAGIMAQSVGGGGGTAGYGEGTGSITDVDLAVGGTGGGSGNGGYVSVTQNGSIATLGNLSYGIFAQSVGGGGGAGGAGQADYTSKITIGGSGGAAGNGGEVDVNMTGDITTHGNGAFGILAQSVGGGGGVGGDVTGSPITLGPFTLYDRPVTGVFAFGGGGANAGNGGAVNVNSKGTIITYGQRADGIEAQSVGGGGGIGGSNQGGAIFSGEGSAGGAGMGGTVSVTHHGSIYTNSENADAIFAQSVGCLVTSTTTCTTPSGAALVGLGLTPGSVLAGGSDITVSVSGGTYRGGALAGAGIEINGGRDNTITIGKSATVTAVSDLAIHATSDDSTVTDSVNNSGRVFGNVALTGGMPATFNNLKNGDLRPLGFVYLAGGTLTNRGLLDPAGTGIGTDISLNGNFVQTSTGDYDVDVGYGITPSDILDVSGNATVGGTVTPHFTALLNKPTVILKADGTLTDAGAGVPGHTVVISYSLTFGTHDLTLNTLADWAPAGMTANETGIGHGFQSLWDAGGAPPLASFMGYLGNITSLGQYSQALDRLHPEPYLAEIVGLESWQADFDDNMMSCHGATGALAAIDEQDCSWGLISVGGVRCRAHRAEHRLFQRRPARAIRSSATCRQQLGRGRLGGLRAMARPCRQSRRSRRPRLLAGRGRQISERPLGECGGVQLRL